MKAVKKAIKNRKKKPAPKKTPAKKAPCQKESRANQSCEESREKVSKEGTGEKEEVMRKLFGNRKYFSVMKFIKAILSGFLLQIAYIRGNVI
ncbi:MAG: hypothetical protein WDO19_03805 [Bacteroidota bacterium]